MKALNISSATARVATDLLITLAILSDTTARRSAVDREDLKPYWKSEKTHIFVGKQDSFRHIFKSSASMYEISGSQFFRTTTEIQSGPDAFDESRFVMIMIFLTIVGVTEILCSKKIPESSRLEFLEKFLANNFALSDAEDNTLGPLNSRGIADLPFLRTLVAFH